LRTASPGASTKISDAPRNALGWEGSVIALRGAYQLDPNITWEYDVREARSHGAVSGNFLAGIYSDWALEVGRELEVLHNAGGL
jgi:hypothetical protein